MRCPPMVFCVGCSVLNEANSSELWQVVLAYLSGRLLGGPNKRLRSEVLQHATPPHPNHLVILAVSRATAFAHSCLAYCGVTEVLMIRPSR